MTYNEAIKHFGTQEAIGRAAGVGQSAVAAWKERGRIPLLSQMMIERSTGGKLKADPLPKLQQQPA